MYGKRNPTSYVNYEKVLKIYVSKFLYSFFSPHKSERKHALGCTRQSIGVQEESILCTINKSHEIKL